MRSWLVSWTLWFLLLALLAALPQTALALTASQVYEQVKDSVVVVKAYDQKGQPVAFGSGIILPSGDIITNYHVVKTGVRYKVSKQIDITKLSELSDAELEKIANTSPSKDNDFQGATTTPATLKTGDPDKDLCLLTATVLTGKPARLGKSAKLKVGEKVYAVGAPQGLELSLSEGIVSQLRGDPPPIIQTTVTISKGSSGGGLFNTEGELVGITTFYLKDGQSLNFALPVEWIGEITATAKNFIPYTGKVIPLKPAWSDRADVLGKAEDWPGLLAHCRRWTQAEPDNGVAWYFLGVAYGKLGRNREKIAAYRESLRLKPDNAYAWNNLGTTYAKMGRYSEAIAAYREALRLEPDSAWAWCGLALAYAQSGNRRAALEAVKELRRYDPKEADKLFNLIIKP